MTEAIVLTATSREKVGSLSAEKLRKHGRIPAVVYGHKEATESVSIALADLMAILKQRTRTLDLDVGGKKQHVQIKELQHDYLGDTVTHVDFQRVYADEKIQTTVTIELRGTAIGTLKGGVLDQPMHTVTIECPADQIPESIKVKIDELAVDMSIHVRELVLPPGVRVIANPDAVVVQVRIPEAEVAPVEATGAGPEVITARKKDADEEK